jgi:hypothetical protein
VAQATAGAERSPGSEASRAFDHERAWADFTRHAFLKFLTIVWLVALLALTSYLMAALWNSTVEHKTWPYNDLEIRNLSGKKTALYAFFSGGLGATIYALHGFLRAVGPQRLESWKYRYDPSWTWWYLSWPFVGATIGVVSYGALTTGIEVLGTDDTSKTAYAVVAFLTGLNARAVLEVMRKKVKERLGIKDDESEALHKDDSKPAVASAHT